MPFVVNSSNYEAHRVRMAILESQRTRAQFCDSLWCCHPLCSWIIHKRQTNPRVLKPSFQACDSILNELWKRLYLFFLRRFAKLEKSAITFVMSVRPSVRVEHLGSHRTNFDELWYLRLFRKCVKKIQFSSKSDKNNENFTWRRFHIYDNISLISS
jgi:hypothetical protein